MKGWQWARSLLTMFLIAAAHAPCTFLEKQRVFNENRIDQKLVGTPLHVEQKIFVF
jgi:hypothetical protein